MHIKKILGIVFLFSFYLFNCSDKNLKTHGQIETKIKELFCPGLNHQKILDGKENHRIDLLRDSVENSQKKSQDLYLEALALEINGNKDKADRIAFQAYLESLPHSKQLKDKDSVACVLNSLLRISFLNQETKEKIKEELVFELTRDIKKMLIKAQEDDTECKLQFYEMYNSLEDIYNNCLSLIEDNLDKKEKVDLLNHLEIVKSFLDKSRMQESVRLLFLDHANGKKSIIDEYKGGLDYYFQKFEELKEDIRLRAFIKSKILFLRLKKEKIKREEFVNYECLNRDKIYKDFQEVCKEQLKKEEKLKEIIHQFNIVKKSFLGDLLSFNNVSRKEFYEELHSFFHNFSHKKIISSIKVNEQNHLFNEILSYSTSFKKQGVVEQKVIRKNNKDIGFSILVFDGEHQKERGFLFISLLKDLGIDFSGLEKSDLSYDRIVLKILNFHISSSKSIKCVIFPKEDKIYFEVLSVSPCVQEEREISLQQSQNLSLSGSIQKESSDLTAPPPLPEFKKISIEPHKF